jgi:hypothetical protein
MGAFTTNDIQYYGWFDFSYITPGTDSTTKVRLYWSASIFSEAYDGPL